MKLVVLPMLLFGVLLNVGAQLALKAGLNRMGNISFAWSNLMTLTTQFAVNPWMWVGLACYTISIAVWIFVLSRVDVSIAYPLVSIGYILNAIGAYYLLGENISLLRAAGTIVILIGVLMVVRS